MKNLLKSFKLNENNISMLLGAAVIVIVGFLVVNYFKSTEEAGTTLPAGGTSTEQEVKLPTTHVVDSGETLWSIAEKYYKSGYNWVDIQTANSLTEVSVITKGQELTIPDVLARATTVEENLALTTPSPSASPVALVTVAPTPTIEPEAKATTKGGELIEPTTPTTGTSISGTNYTVLKGDNLWSIAERAYGDGFRWTEIAKANNLLHPGLIHSGNILQIPR